MTVSATDFNPSDLGRVPDPYALLEEMRRGGSVLRSRDTWIVLGHAEALSVLRSPAARSGFIGAFYRSFLPPGAAHDEMSHRINFLDPPDHTRVRALVAKAFTPRRTAELEPYVESASRRLLEPLAGRPTVDLLTAFAHQVPSLVISELLGVPVEDRDRLTALSDRVALLLSGIGLDEHKIATALAAAEEMHAYLRALVAERRREPRDDLLSALLAVEDNAEKLSEPELLSLAATLYSAGHRTTRDLFSNGLAVLLADRELGAGVRDGERRASAVVEEFARFETPTHYIARMLVEPLDLGEVTLPADEPVTTMLAAANRDPAAYDDAATFDPRRWLKEPAPPPPLSFAFGPHFCLGASLARMEARAMLHTLFDVLPDVELAAEPLRWRHTGLFRGLEALPVRPGRANT